MNDKVQQALENDQLIDVTTTGRKTGEPRRIEIWFHHLDGRIYITGQPGRRSWYANLLADPRFTFHLKQSTQADLSARAIPVRDSEQRREIFAQILGKLGYDDQLSAWVDGSPLVEVTLET